jgi:hypothetical protein
MKVFISWSGDRSKAVAETLRDWIPNVIQAVKPWISSRDIPKGARWSQHIASQLEGAKVGIICLTPENLKAEWMLYELGALAKTLDETFVCTYLLDMKPTDVRDPLAQFQATTAADKSDTRKMLQTINTAAGDQGLSEKQLDSVFDKWWPDLDQALRKIPAVGLPPARRSTEDMLEEALGLLRGLARAISSSPYLQRSLRRRLSTSHAVPASIMRQWRDEYLSRAVLL